MAGNPSFPYLEYLNLDAVACLVIDAFALLVEAALAPCQH